MCLGWIIWVYNTIFSCALLKTVLFTITTKAMVSFVFPPHTGSHIGHKHSWLNWLNPSRVCSCLTSS